MDDTSDPLPLTPGALADALGAVRARIKALKAQESALRDAIVAARPNGPVTGTRFEVSVLRTRRRSLDKDRLPPAILENDRFWKLSEARTVLTRELPGDRSPVDEPAPSPTAAEDEFDVFEPF